MPRLPVPLPALPPTRLATLRDGVVGCIVTGSGRPAILLMNGAGGPMTGWARVLGPVAELGTVVATDRPGVGRSSQPRIPQTGGVVVRRERALLQALGIEAPVVLVGHSLGGLFVQLYARLHPAEVAGVVFVEAAHPDDRLLQRPAWLRAITALLALPSRAARTPRLGEVDHVDETIRELAASGPFPDVPVAVVRGARRPPRWLAPEHVVVARQASHARLAALSTTSRTFEADAGHFPQLSDPATVVDAIRWVVETARTSAR